MDWFKLWAFVLATAGFIVGAYLIFRAKQIRLGGITVCVSLSIVAVSTFFIEHIDAEASNSFNLIVNRLDAVSNRVAEVEVQLNQAISMKQQVSQTVNVVTQVKKEIANLREMIVGLYSRVELDVFPPNDDSGRMVSFKKRDGALVMCFLLRHAPVENSVSGMFGNKVLRPDTVVGKKNLVITQFAGFADHLTNDVFTFTYVRDDEVTDLFSAIERAGEFTLVDGVEISDPRLQ